MDSLTNFHNGNKPSLHNKPRSNFSQAAVSKGDVGDFQEGYFVMAEMPPLPQQRNKTHKTPERNQRKNEHRQYHTKERSTKDIELLLQRESDSNVSNVRITTSPTRSPPRNKRISNSHSPQRQQQTTTHNLTNPVPSSPHKARKAHSQTNFHEKRFVERSESTPSFSLEGSSPPRDKGPSPPSTRWAGPAFSNAPPPSSLPIPDFPPFAAATTATNPSSPALPSPSKSPSFSGPSFASQPLMYHQSPMFIHPHAHVPAAYQGYPLHLGHHEMHSQPPSLAQLSTDLRRMLNIHEQPIQLSA